MKGEPLFLGERWCWRDFGTDGFGLFTATSGSKVVLCAARHWRNKTPRSGLQTRDDTGILTALQPEFPRARVMAAAPELLAVAKECLEAELERRKKLLPDAPATTYTQARIDRLTAAINAAEGTAP